MGSGEGRTLLLNVARWVDRSEANGPGVRFVLWLQGCPFRCEGCWNPDTWDFTAGKRLSVDDIMEVIAGVRGIEGVTVTGGEPFAQASALRCLVSRIRSAGLSVMVFTGHEMDELRSDVARQVLAATDIVVTGRFVLAERDVSLRWRGSRNQQVHFLTQRYSADLMHTGGLAEVVIGNDGTIHVTGFPEDALLTELSRTASS
jgi:anaerobic ribonucleoside-triphosphate reductase activating protein